MRKANNVLELVGNTPMVRINKLVRKNYAQILAKLEMFNPTGSVKDRIVKYMIEKMEKEGKLKKDKVILEASSGNTGIALAMVGTIKGYKTLIIAPKEISKEKRTMIKAFGGKLILTPSETEAIKLANKMVRKNPDKYFLLGQFENELNVLAHYETTGKEIIEQTKGKVDMVIGGIGTTGTLVGIAKRLKEFNERIKIVAVQPLLGEIIPGLINLKEFKPSIFNEKIIDEIVEVSLKDAIKMTKKLAREEGLFVGLSSGAAMHVAVKKAKKLGKEKTIVVILPDSGERYISTKIFN